MVLSEILEPRPVKDRPRPNVSPGFIRSSFVLQKYAPEGGGVLQPPRAAAAAPALPPARAESASTTLAESDSDDDTFDLVNLFVPSASRRSVSAPHGFKSVLRPRSYSLGGRRSESTARSPTPNPVRRSFSFLRRDSKEEPSPPQADTQKASAERPGRSDAKHRKESPQTGAKKTRKRAPQRHEANGKHRPLDPAVLPKTRKGKQRPPRSPTSSGSSGGPHVVQPRSNSIMGRDLSTVPQAQPRLASSSAQALRQASPIHHAVRTPPSLRSASSMSSMGHSDEYQTSSSILRAPRRQASPTSLAGTIEEVETSSDECLDMLNLFTQ